MQRSGRKQWGTGMADGEALKQELARPFKEQKQDECSWTVMSKGRVARKKFGQQARGQVMVLAGASPLQRVCQGPGWL